MFTSVVIFIITLLILVVIHELGHFLVAKKFGIKVEEFGFGIPPRAWGKKVGETLVSINWLPFGGFVRLLGEDEVDKKVLANPRSFAAQKVEKRIAVVAAGVVMNLILAWVLFYFYLGFQGFKVDLPLLLPHHFVGVTENTETLVLVRSIVKDSPAEKAGLKPGEMIVALNEKPLADSRELIDETKNLAGSTVNLTVTTPDKGSYHSVTLTPRKDPPAGQGPLGVELAGVTVAHLEYSGTSKIFAGPIHSWNLIAYSGRIMGFLVGQSFKTSSFGPVSESFSGPVGISSTVNSILTETSKPILEYLNFIAILSLNLAVFNVLPIPALDGGRLFFLIFEAITRRKVKVEVERLIHTVGLSLLLALMLLVTISDIKKLLP